VFGDPTGTSQYVTTEASVDISNVLLALVVKVAAADIVTSVEFTNELPTSASVKRVGEEGEIVSVYEPEVRVAFGMDWVAS
jgi:hypothetical protein